MTETQKAGALYIGMVLFLTGMVAVFESALLGAGMVIVGVGLFYAGIRKGDDQ